MQRRDELQIHSDLGKKEMRDACRKLDEKWEGLEQRMKWLGNEAQGACFPRRARRRSDNHLPQSIHDDVLVTVGLSRERGLRGTSASRAPSATSCASATCATGQTACTPSAGGDARSARPIPTPLSSAR
jgi:hypothetical protein